MPPAATVTALPPSPTPQPDCVKSAQAAGLRYTTDSRPGIRRRRNGNGFTYISPDGRVVRDRADLDRIRALAIPPAWTDVWICTDSRGHLQATGRDAKGRKQYRYHPRWHQVRDDNKYERLIAFAQALPKIRKITAEHLSRPGLPREKVLATVVQLLEKTLIRVGNDEYARNNHSYGLTTLRDGHVQVRGPRVRFAFRGKSGVEHEVDLNDRRLARIVKQCRDIPGYDLFQYIDEQGERQTVASDDVNAYLKEITGQDLTSKDFRTWAGTVLAARLLSELEVCSSETQAKKNIVGAVEEVAKRLGNTKAVCRKCYIHPAVLDSYVEGAMVDAIAQRVKKVARRIDRLTEDEQAVVRLLQRRVMPEMRKKAS